MASNGAARPAAVQKLRAMLEDPQKLVVCPGVYDGYTARIALAEGADCLYMVCVLSHFFYISMRILGMNSANMRRRLVLGLQCRSWVWRTWASQL